MRRALLFTGIAAGTIALFTTAGIVSANGRAHRIESFKTRLSDLTFCRTGLEILSSKSHYSARFESDDSARTDLLEASDALESRREAVDELIAQTLHDALYLPMEPASRRMLVEQIQWDAELDAVQTSGWSGDDNHFLDQIEAICDQYLN